MVLVALDDTVVVVVMDGDSPVVVSLAFMTGSIPAVVTGHVQPVSQRPRHQRIACEAVVAVAAASIAW